MTFDDDQHIARIAAALWRRAPTGRAAVLVGAGFSPNARPLRDSQPIMPGWTALVERMVGDLYGDAETGNERHRKAALDTAAATSSALRIAQEYETEFGRDALDRLILENVPDEAFGPGPLHQLLVELPWADILTTNWDTLLERAAKTAEDRVYATVRTVEDVPSASGPRIVKLHGSFPSNRPFILTEEDFRTYPERFAPFLNLARQTTMENVLVLVGFSGDDPNFLYWSGWVRDQLGEHAPTIYLVGPLALSSSRRKMLEKRRIQTIDLTRLPAYSDWPEETRRGLAIQWFLERLTAAKPYPRVRWPKVLAEQTHLTLLSPSPDPGAPKPWPRPGGSRWTIEQVETEILPTLRHNRLLYPGWIVAPRRARASIWQFLENGIAEAGAVIPKLEPAKALALAYEFNWLSERALVPLFSNIETPITPILEALDLPALAPEEFDQAVDLMFALLRSDRESDRPEGVTTWEARLSALALTPAARDRLQHERCLWALMTLDYDQLDALLSEWSIESDPFWMVRKAGLLAENDRLEEARILSKTALDAIRERTDKDAEDIGAWSREAYTLLFRSFAVASEIEFWERGLQERDTVSSRLYTLAARGCGAEEDFEGYAAAVQFTPPQIRPRVEKVRGFDVGNVATTEHWSNQSPSLNRRQALEAFRFFEQIGAPSRISPVSVAAPAYAGVARWLLGVDDDRAMVALTRTAGLSDKDGVEVSFSRDTVAALDDDVARRWGERLLVGVKALIDRLNNPAMARSAEARLKVLVEMLSRMAARRPELAGPAVDLGLELHAHHELRYLLEKPLDALFRRTFKVLPDELVAPYRRKLFEAPIPVTTNSYYKDPAQAGSEADDMEPGDAEFEGVITRTTAAVRDANLRYAAVMRLQWLHASEALTSEQIEAFSAALWDDRFVKDGLPDGTPLLPWVFAQLPYPAGADPASAAKARILALEDVSSEDGLGVLAGLYAGEPPAITLSVREFKSVLGKFLAKAAPKPDEDRPSRLPGFFTQDRLGWRFWQAFDGLFALSVKQPSLKALFAAYYAGNPRVEAARSVVIALEAGIVTPAYAEDMLLRAWAGDELQALTAAFASIRWAGAKPQGKPLPPVIWEIAADGVATMDEHAVLAALEFLRGSYTTLAKAVPRRLDGRLARALFAILDRTGRPDVRLSLPVDPGAVRKAAARLVAAMDRAGRAPTSLLETWREAGRREGVGEIREGLRRERSE